MGYYNANGEWIEGDPPPQPARRQPRRMRPASERQHDPNPGVRQQARRQLRAGYYDDAGNFVHGEPANLAETTEDVVRSIPGGLQTGAAAFVAFPGMLERLTQQGGQAARQGAERLVGRSEEQIAETQRHIDDMRRRPTLLEVAGNPGAYEWRGNWLTGYFERRPTISSLIAGEDDVSPTRNARFTFPSFEQVEGAIRSVEPEPVQEAVDYEPQTQAGRYARTISEFAPSALFPGTLTERAARMVVPGAASEAAGQLTEGTPAEPYARFAAGLGAAGVTEGFIYALRRGGLSPDERALRLILREMEDQGQSTDDIVRQANILLRQAPTEEVLAETLGDGGLRLARAVAAMGRGAGRSTAEETLAARAEGRPSMRQTTQRPGQRGVTSIRDRIADEAARMTAPEQTRAPRSYDDALDALRTARAGQGDEAYRAAHAVVPDAEAVNSQIIPYMRDAPREAFNSAVRQLETEAARVRARISTARMSNAPEDEVAALMRELDDILTGRQQLQLFAEGTVPNTVNSRAMDYFQRGLSQMERAAGRGSPEASAIAEARAAYNQMADRINPAFADARARYGESIRIEEYMNEGRQVFNMTEGQIDRVLRGARGAGLTLEEFDGFMLGVMDAIETKLGASDTGFLARLMRNQNWRDQLTTAVGGEQQARRFMDRLAREARMQETRNFVRSGSRTTPLGEDIKALTAGEAELGFMQREARNFIASGGSVRSAALRIATSIWERVHSPGIANPQVQEALARRLFTRVTRDSSQELRAALNALRDDQTVSPALREWLSRVTSANAAMELDDDTVSGSLAQDYADARREAQSEPAPVN